MFWFLKFIFLFFLGRAKFSAVFPDKCFSFTLPFCLPVIWKNMPTKLSLDNLGKWGFDNSPHCHTEFYDDDQGSGLSYFPWTISKICIKDNSKSHLFELALVFIQDPWLLPARSNFYSSQEEACTDPEVILYHLTTFSGTRGRAPFWVSAVWPKEWAKYLYVGGFCVKPCKTLMLSYEALGQRCLKSSPGTVAKAHMHNFYFKNRV